MEDFGKISLVKTNLIMFKILGLWPNNEKYKSDFYTLYMVISISVYLFAHSVFFMIGVFFNFKSDIWILIFSLMITLTHIIAFLKTCVFALNIKRLKILMTNLESEIFQPKSIEQRNKIESTLKSCNRGNKIFISVVYTTVALFLLIPILAGTTKNYTLPFHAWYPWYTKKSPAYEITYLYQCISIVFRTTASLSIDTFINVLNTYVAAQCILLCYVMQNLNMEGDVHYKLRKNFLYHKAILSFAKNSNILLNWNALYQFFSSSVAVALALFLLSMVNPFSNEARSLLFYIAAMILEVFMYCWFGNEVEVQSSQIPYSAFESDWTGIPIEAKKNLLIFIMRAQKPIKMSAINLFSLSLATFTTILRTSWSYFAVLRQVNAQD